MNILYNYSTFVNPYYMISLVISKLEQVKTTIPNEKGGTIQMVPLDLVKELLLSVEKEFNELEAANQRWRDLYYDN